MERHVRRLLPILLGVTLAGPATAGTQRYGADLHESRWVVDGNRLQCRLSHDIPLYGTATFSRVAGQELGFHMRVWREPRRRGVARLASLPPDWKFDTSMRDLGQVEFQSDKQPFRFREALSRRLLAELESGMFPTLRYRDWADGRDEVRVQLSAVNVRQALGEFLACLDGMLTYTFDDVRESRLLFPFDSSELTPAMRRRLDKVAAYLLADAAVHKIRLDGHTDSIGFRRYNDALSRRRSEAVRDYLIAKGVPAERFDIRYFGERKPEVPNRSAEQRRQNRRVVLTLLK